MTSPVLGRHSGWTESTGSQFVRVKLEDIKEGTEGNFVKRARGDSQWFERGDVDTFDTPFGK